MDIKQKIEKKVFSFMEEHHMLKSTDKVVVGVSGGADSVCLLFVLLEYRKQIPFSLAVVHVNHGIRQEAAGDAHYVEELCSTQGLSFYPFYVDVRQKAKQDKCSEEEAGRNARYEAFCQVAAEFGGTKIAVAHNSNDRSETMLFHLFRGSSLKGLSSIRPVRENIIRPILCLERREVEEYLNFQQIPYCKDATNDEDDYTRNRIRHHILPYAEQEIVSGCVSHMAQTAGMLQEVDDYLEQQTRVAMDECVKDNEIQVEGFLKQHKVIQQRILHTILAYVCNSAKDISYIHIQNLMSLFTRQGNRSVNLPYGLIGRRQYDRVILEWRQKKSRESSLLAPEEKQLCVPDEVWLNQEQQLCMQIMPPTCNYEDFPINQYTKWLDYDKIEKSLVLRTRRKGDYFTIQGKDGKMLHKSLKDYMITEKIPRNERDELLLLAEDSHVIWLIGYRISEYYKISRNTKHILQVQLKRTGCRSNGTEEENG